MSLIINLIKNNHKKGEGLTMGIEAIEIAVAAIILLFVLATYFMLRYRKQTKLLELREMRYQVLLREFQLCYSLLKGDDFTDLVTKLKTVFLAYEQVGTALVGDSRASLENSLLRCFKMQITNSSINLTSFKNLVLQILEAKDDYNICVINPLEVMSRLIRGLSLQEKFILVNSDLMDDPRIANFIMSVISKEIAKSKTHKKIKEADYQDRPRVFEEAIV